MARNTTADPVGLEDEQADVGPGEPDGPESQGAFAGEGFGRNANGTFGDEDRDPSYDDNPEVPLADDPLIATTAAAGIGPRPDQSIAEEIADLLAERLGIDLADVSVRVDDGTVMLAGLVESDHLRDGAENIALSVEGVTAIDNRLSTR